MMSDYYKSRLGLSSRRRIAQYVANTIQFLEGSTYDKKVVMKASWQDRLTLLAAAVARPPSQKMRPFGGIHRGGDNIEGDYSVDEVCRFNDYGAITDDDGQVFSPVVIVLSVQMPMLNGTLILKSRLCMYS